jgi:hypothetical protein
MGHRCDIYAYESDSGFEVHVASRRYVIPDDVQPPTYDDPEWINKWKAWGELLRDAELVPIGLPFDGASYRFDTENEMFACLAELALAGYNVPAGLLTDDPNPRGAES